jgi:DNA-directed RNA polymerase subunit M/transcription elongation factor TFIIS
MDCLKCGGEMIQETEWSTDILMKCKTCGHEEIVKKEGK